MPDTDTVVKPDSFIDVIGKALEGLSGEYLLTFFRYPNGGTVVFLRAAHVTVVIFLLALAIVNGLDPARGSEFSWTELSKQLVQHVAWIGGIFATAYALLYARFASQWTYVAGVYNQLKAAQTRDDVKEDAITEWRAAFIEDCDELHLLRKPMFASIVNELVNSKAAHAAKVKKAFADHAPGGQARLDKICKDVEAVVAKVAARYSA